MPLWQTFLITALTLALAFAGLCALLAMLYHVRFEAAWMGMWTGTASLPHEKFLRLEHGFPGFMRPLTWSHEADDDAESESLVRDDTAEAPVNAEPKSDIESPRAETFATPAAAPADTTTNLSERPVPDGFPDTFAANRRETPDPDTGTTGTGSVGGQGGKPPGAEADPGATASPSATTVPHRKASRRRKSVNQYRRALFRFVTDGPAWRLQSGYFLRSAKSALRLANVHVELSAGHPDPAKLGRFAGYWYALSPFLPLKGASMAFRFQEHHPLFGVRVTAAFSLFAVARFGARLVLTFPYIRLSQRAWQGWRERRLTGWRAFVYRKIQTF